MQATERQKIKMQELKIEFDHEIEFDEAAEIIRENLPPSKFKADLSGECMVVMSEIKLDEL